MRAIKVKPMAIILEPFGRNTAPAITLGALKALERDKDAILLDDIVDRISSHLNNGKPLRSIELSKLDKAALKALNLLTLKPVFYIANVKEDGFDNNPHLASLINLASNEKSLVIPICNKIEAEIAEFSEIERNEFLDMMGLSEPGLNKVITTGYEILNLHT